MSTLGVLRQADIFYGFSAEQLERVASICQERQFGAGEIIFKENSSSDELYVIARGEVEIVIDPALVSDRPDTPSRPTTIATLRRGQSFGEVALVDQGLRSATARSASHDTQLLAIPRSGLIELCDRDTRLGYRLMFNLAADLALKIRNTDLRVREQLLYGERRRG
ncbi:MAG: cyclic nucleotide-binding domain-containing protein [Chloroflexota bacterium]